MPSRTEKQTEQKREIHHTVSGGHSVDPAELLRSEKVQRIIADVAERLEVVGPAASRPSAGDDTDPAS